VIPSTRTVAAVAAQKPFIIPTDFSIVNQPGADSYPISGYDWALIYARQQNQARGQALARANAGGLFFHGPASPAVASGWPMDRPLAGSKNCR
jgi:hypothetical protein